MTGRQIVFGVGALFLASSALAAEPAQDGKVEGSVYSEAVRSTDVAATDELTAGANEEKVICKRDKVLGSRVTAQRVCKTAQEWEREKAAQRQMVERGQNQRTLDGN